MTAQHRVVGLEFSSAFEMVDVVQVVSNQVGRSLGFDDDSLHWVSVAVREAVINAMKHGNRGDGSKKVFVEFAARQDADASAELTVKVRDQGEGFNPEEVADPLAPENLLKSSGRGIFLIRAFMDEMQLRRSPLGGMEMCITKRRAAGGPASS